MAQPPPGTGNGTRFYADLPVLADFDGVAHPENYAPLPDDWHVALCDVRNSTAAVQAGNYKSVNSLGAAAITAVLNAAGEIEVPFTFEGDGCALCVPAQLLADTRAALAKVRDIAKDSFRLDLRVGTVPMGKIREAGYAILVARYRVSEHTVQAVFAGGGMACADRFIKDPARSGEYLIAPGSVVPRGSLDGFECRWRDIPSRHGETVSLMVRALDPDASRAGALYAELVAAVRDIYGSDDVCHPLSVRDLAFTLESRYLAKEAGVRAYGRGALGKWLWMMRTRWFVALGWFLMTFGIRTAETDWRDYKKTLVRNSDVRKFNDAHRQILAGTEGQRRALDAWLDERYRRGELVYGLHASDRAQMTCLVFEYSGRHLHFVDGADGGLFLAAQAFKKRAAQLADRPR
jgi:hypothetical protein